MELEDNSVRTETRRHSYRTIAVLVDLMLLDCQRIGERSRISVKWCVGLVVVSLLLAAVASSALLLNG